LRELFISDLLCEKIHASSPLAGPQDSKKAASQPAVEPTETVSKNERHDQDARPQDDPVQGLAQIEVADTTDEQVANGKVEEAP